MYLSSLIQAVSALGMLPFPEGARKPIDVKDASRKVEYVLDLAKRLGMLRSYLPLRLAALAAIKLDDWAETGEYPYLVQADECWTSALESLTPDVREVVSLSGAASISFFWYERQMRERLLKGDIFTYYEIIAYLMRRSEDTSIYAAILSIDGIEGEGLIAGLRIRQALRDILDDCTDLDQDRDGVGFNILLAKSDQPCLASTLTGDLLVRASRFKSSLPKPIMDDCQSTYKQIQSILYKI